MDMEAGKTLTNEEVIRELLELLKKNAMKEQANDVFEICSYVDGLEKKIDSMTEELTNMQNQIKEMQEDTLVNNAKKALSEAQERLNARCEQIKSQLLEVKEQVKSTAKGIVEEAKAMGVTVFLLDNTTLPSEIEGEYNDGFEKLTKMLYAQFGEDIKFIEAVDVTINDYNISNEDVTDENGDTVYNTTSSSSDSEEFTTGYGDSSEIDGEETSATKKREPLTDEDGDIIYGNDGQPVYPTEQGSTSQLTTQSSNSLEKQIENKISEKSSNNKMYYISTNNAEKVKKILDNKKITNYIIKSIN